MYSMASKTRRGPLVSSVVGTSRTLALWAAVTQRLRGAKSVSAISSYRIMRLCAILAVTSFDSLSLMLPASYGVGHKRISKDPNGPFDSRAGCSEQKAQLRIWAWTSRAIAIWNERGKFANARGMQARVLPTGRCSSARPITNHGDQLIRTNRQATSAGTEHSTSCKLVAVS